MLKTVPQERIRTLTRVPPNREGAFVLYWMTANRRLESNFSLQRAVELARQWNKPLLILESLRLRYRWASERFHRFVLDGMIDNAMAASRTNAFYLAHVESQSEGPGLMEWMAGNACAMVTDDFPCFFHPVLYERVVQHWPCCVELVDSNGILPMHGTDRIFTVAHSYRLYMQKEIASHLDAFPEIDPLANLPSVAPPVQLHDAARRWSLHSLEGLRAIDLSTIPIDHRVSPTEVRGGSLAANEVLQRFADHRMGAYAEARNRPEHEGASGLSPYLHFGHLSAHQVFHRITQAVGWSPEYLGKPNGKMHGYWKVDLNAEAFLDQLLTWREIGFNQCSHVRNYDRYESLPAWALKTLEDHANDPRPSVYKLEQFENAATHDPLWNAAQRQLAREGRIHNYLRMLWGKKILHWSASPRDALRIMIELNNKYALDGRDPNSYSGIFWVLGRFDRAWGPERPIFGKIRYMTSESTARKYDVQRYLSTYSHF